MWRVGAVVVVLGALAGCDRHDSRICSAPPAIAAAAASTSEAKEAVADGCIHRWSYRLARSNESVSEVAKAVVGGCQEPIVAWVSARIDEDKQSDFRPFISPFTGAQADPFRALVERKEALATFHVVQARAGHCRVP